MLSRPCSALAVFARDGNPIIAVHRALLTNVQSLHDRKENSQYSIMGNFPIYQKSGEGDPGGNPGNGDPDETKLT